MTHRLTIVATYKAPPGHNRLTDVTLAVVATFTTDGTITIEFDDPDVDSMTTSIIASEVGRIRAASSASPLHPTNATFSINAAGVSMRRPPTPPLSRRCGHFRLAR